MTRTIDTTAAKMSDETIISMSVMPSSGRFVIGAPPRGMNTPDQSSEQTTSLPLRSLRAPA
jgi:hypothetical protein